MSIQVINLAQKLSLFGEMWKPKIVGELNDTHVKVVKATGAFVWHHHAAEDELFLVVKGTLTIKVRDPEERDLVIRPGEFVVIPRNVEHCPVANEEVHVMLLEPKTTLNTGNVSNERTTEAERI